MLFKQPFLEGIAAGRITQAFRRWKRPTVKAGGTLTTSIGVLRIKSVEGITPQQITPQAVQRAGFTSLDDLLASLGDWGGQLYQIQFQRAGDDPRIALRENDDISAADLEELTLRLARLDRASKVGAWTDKVLRLIAQYPALRAAELAAHSKYDKEWLKLNIRKLKNLGLTESLQVGYRLSARGEAFLAAS